MFTWLKNPRTSSYDPDGNLTSDGRRAYTWDAENRLIGLTANTTVGPQYQLAFAYDAKGRRIQKIVSLWNPSTLNYQPSSTNCFLYDGWNLVAILNPQSSILDSFVWGSDLSGSMQGAGGVGGLLELSYYGASTTNCFPAFDGNGNLAALVNAADGTIVANYEYGPFGEVIRSTGPMAKANPVRFSTKYQDYESDLLYYGHRYYKPSTGTWLSRDPLGKKGGANMYGFVRNRPISGIDRLGLIGLMDPPNFPADPLPPPPGYFTLDDLYNAIKGMSSVARLICCSCDKSTGMKISINGTPSGEQVTETITTSTFGCADSITILAYVWWDCFSAQAAAGNDPNWQNYGWHIGSNPQTQSEEGDLDDVQSDSGHWNWQGGVLYLCCSSGHYQVKLALSESQEWDWDDDDNSWVNPHSGNGPHKGN